MVYMVIDCGTTNLRATVVDGNGQVYSVSKRPGGVRNTAIDGHNGRLKAMLKEALEEALSSAHMTWRDIAGCYAYGMITSNVGLLEVPHLVAPVSVNDLSDGMQEKLFPEITPLPIRFIPGVRNFSGEVNLENFTSMDMMRGEEVEAVGLWNMLKPENECVLILPGSHNKFVHMDKDGRILGCMTSISGELLDALTNHTILADAVGRTFASAEDYDSHYAIEGAKECLRSGIGRAAFSGRILNQLGGVPQEKLRSYLLGATLAQDILALKAFVGEDKKLPDLFIAGNQPVVKAIAEIGVELLKESPCLVSWEATKRMGIEGALAVISQRT